MPEVIVYGASDDLIEVEGAVREEYSCDGYGSVLLVGPVGEVVHVAVYMDDEGDWQAKPKIRRMTAGYNVETDIIARPHAPEGTDDRAARVTFSSPGTVLAYDLKVSED